VGHLGYCIKGNVISYTGHRRLRSNGRVVNIVETRNVEGVLVETCRGKERLELDDKVLLECDDMSVTPRRS
jgi:hypothetical protein